MKIKSKYLLLILFTAIVTVPMLMKIFNPINTEIEEVFNVAKYIPVENCEAIVELPKECEIAYEPPLPEPEPEPEPEVALASEEGTEEVQPVLADNNSYNRMSRGGYYEPPAVSVAMTEDERYWLEKLIEAESADEPYDGKLAVATTIANRVKDIDFPDTVMEVIEQEGQYSPYDDGSIHRRTASSDTIKAVSEVFDKGVRTLSEDVVYFYAPIHSPTNWIESTRKYVTTIGGHIFSSKYGK